MNFKVSFTENAKQDLLEIFYYVVAHGSPQKAKTLIEKLEKLCSKLETFPYRGHYTPELEAVGIALYREVHYKPYRIIYQVLETEVIIHCVIDGRRDLYHLLQKKLLQ